MTPSYSFNTGFSQTLFVMFIAPSASPFACHQFFSPVGFTKITIIGLQVDIQVSAQIVGQERHPAVMSAEQRGAQGILTTSHGFKRELPWHLMRDITTRTQAVSDSRSPSVKQLNHSKRSECDW